MISVVCPFYNEEPIIENAVRRLLARLASLPDPCELVLVDDGSTDRSLQIVESIAEGHPGLRVISYPNNRGRGYALRCGIAASRGDPIVTTEIDLSWGEDIVQRIVAAFREYPAADVIVASPHLPGGGYRNVPGKRVLLSRIGNWIIRSCLSYGVTMNTGMTRGYRREKILQLPLREDGKELHLEIIDKAMAFGYAIREIPAVIEWKDHRLRSPEGPARKSSSKIPRLVRSHLLFSSLASPFRYILALSMLLAVAGTGFIALAVYYLFTPMPSIFALLVGMLLWLFGLVFAGIGILARQNRSLLLELWRIQAAGAERKAETPQATRPPEIHVRSRRDLKDQPMR